MNLCFDRIVNSKFEFILNWLVQLNFVLQSVNMSSDKYKFNYKIPECMIKCFTEYATKNKSSVDKKHIETLAFLVGYKEDNEIIGTDLVFPKQKGAAFDVEDHGKCFFKIS